MRLCCMTRDEPKQPGEKIEKVSNANNKHDNQMSVTAMRERRGCRLTDKRPFEPKRTMPMERTNKTNKMFKKKAHMENLSFCTMRR